MSPRAPEAHLLFFSPEDMPCCFVQEKLIGFYKVGDSEFVWQTEVVAECSECEATLNLGDVHQIIFDHRHLLSWRQA